MSHTAIKASLQRRTNNEEGIRCNPDRHPARSLDGFGLRAVFHPADQGDRRARHSLSLRYRLTGRPEVSRGALQLPSLRPARRTIGKRGTSRDCSWHCNRLPSSIPVGVGRGCSRGRHFLRGETQSGVPSDTLAGQQAQTIQPISAPSHTLQPSSPCSLIPI